MGVRLCSSAQLAMLLELRNLNLPDFVEVSGQPLTAAWLCFMLKYGCQAPIAVNAIVRRRPRGTQKAAKLELCASGRSSMLAAP